MVPGSSVIVSIAPDWILRECAQLEPNDAGKVRWCLHAAMGFTPFSQPPTPACAALCRYDDVDVLYQELIQLAPGLLQL